MSTNTLAHLRCPACGYDVSEQLSAGIHVCPECAGAIGRDICARVGEGRTPFVKSWWAIGAWGVSMAMVLALEPLAWKFDMAAAVAFLTPCLTWPLGAVVLWLWSENLWRKLGRTPTTAMVLPTTIVAWVGTLALGVVMTRVVEGWM